MSPGLRIAAFLAMIGVVFVLAMLAGAALDPQVEDAAPAPADTRSHGAGNSDAH